MNLRESFEEREFQELGPYAAHSRNSRGRDRYEPECDIRTVYQRDRDRILHSKAFRRMKDKTQVFLAAQGDHYRTRLTHTLEVSQIARTIARALNLNEDLTEAIALGHDLGHTPFGHSGEDALNMVHSGGFRHAEQSVRVVEVLEKEGKGLNLTWETLEGTVKHNGPIKRITNRYLKEYNKKFDLDLGHYSSLEGQVGAVADDIAYNNHDIDDGFRAGFFSIEKLRELPFVNDILKEFEKQHPGADDNLKIYAVTRNMIARMIFDVLKNSRDNIAEHKIRSCDDARKQKKFMIDFSDGMKADIKLLRRFLKEYFYTATPIARMDMKSQRIVEELFAVFMNDSKLLPMETRALIGAQAKDAETADVVCEYIAGMTDIAAIEEHRRLFDPHTRF